MVLHVIFSILSILSSSLVFYFTGLYDKWYFYFIPIITIPIIYILLFAIYVGILGLYTIPLSNKKEVTKPSRAYYSFLRQTGTELLIFFNSKIHTSGLEKMPKTRCMIISNHQSSFDPMIALRYAKNHPLICITKPENLSIPIGGKWMHKTGFIPINRENNKEGIKAISKAISYIKEDKSSIYICPEGTRNKKNGLLEFHAGSFKIAYKAKAPLVITCITNSKNLIKDFPFKRTHIYYDVLEVLEYEDYKDKSTQELAEYSRSIILEKLNERNKLL